MSLMTNTVKVTLQNYQEDIYIIETRNMISKYLYPYVIQSLLPTFIQQLWFPTTLYVNARDNPIDKIIHLFIFKFVDNEVLK